MKPNRFHRFYLLVAIFSALVLLAGCLPQHEPTPVQPNGSGETPAQPDSPEQVETNASLKSKTPAEAIEKLGNISGAVYDRKTKRLVLIGSGSNADQGSMRLEDLAVAFKSVLGDDPQEPQFSLDPADPQNPRGPLLRAVYYGPIERTHFGQVMFDADWLLKGYSFGKLRVNGQEQAITSAVPGFKNIFDLAFENPGPTGESYTRFWLTVDQENSEFGREKDAVSLEKIKMKVNTEKMWQTSKGNLESSGGQQDPHAERFAAHFTENFDRFAQEQPALSEVKELGKAVVLAKWIKQRHIKVDPRWLSAASAGNWNTPTTVGALEATQERTSQVPGGRRILQLRLYGGVDLAVEPVFTRNQALGSLKTNIGTLLAKPDASPVFSIMYEGRKYPAMVAPITNPGKIMWEKAGDVSYIIDGRGYILIAWWQPDTIIKKENGFAAARAA